MAECTPCLGGGCGLPNVREGGPIHSPRCSVGAIPRNTKSTQEFYLGKFTRLLGAPGIVPGPSLEMSSILHTEWEEIAIFTHSSSSSSHLPHFFLGPLFLPLSLSSLSLSLSFSLPTPTPPPTHTHTHYFRLHMSFFKAPCWNKIISRDKLSHIQCLD